MARRIISRKVLTIRIESYRKSLPISPVEEKEAQIKEMNKKLKDLEEQVNKYRFNEGISHQNEG